RRHRMAPSYSRLPVYFVLSIPSIAILLICLNIFEAFKESQNARLGVQRRAEPNKKRLPGRTQLI
ncbi:hypothetical protein ABN584_27870, partial [Gloeocapsa sp. BRSZ]